MGQIVRAIDGMAEACAKLDFPVVSGNVSLYNETNGSAIPPTPTVGAVGLLADSKKRCGFGGMKQDDVLVLIGATVGELGASLYLRDTLHREDGAPPPVDLDAEKRSGDLVRHLIQGGFVHAVHDLSDGGLVVAAAEMGLASGVGLFIDDLPEGLPHAVLFGEDQARYLISLSASNQDELDEKASELNVPYHVIGRAGGCELAVKSLFAIDFDDLRAAHEGWMPAYMEG